MIRAYFLFFVTFFVTISVNSQDINIYINSPYPEQIVGENLNISVEVTSTYDILKVEVVFDDIVTELNSSSNNFFNGTISLLDVPQGVQTLQIVATDVLENINSENRTFIYDTKPEVNVILPLDHSVARPGLTIEFEGTDMEGDLPIELSYSVDLLTDNGYLYNLIQSNNMVSEVLDLSDYEGTEITLLYSVTDIRDQTTSVRRQVHIDTSEPLVYEFSVQNEIVDFDGEELLFINRRYIDYPNPNSIEYILETLSKTDINTEEFITIPFPSDPPLGSYGFPAFKLLNQGVSLKAADLYILNWTRSFFWDPNSNITTEIGYTGIEEYDNENHIVTVLENSVVGDDLLFYLFVCEYIEIDPGTYIQECQPHYFIQKISDPSNITPLDGFLGGDEYARIEKIFQDNSILYYDQYGDIILQNNGVKENITNDGIPDEIENIYVRSDGNLYVYNKKIEGDNGSIVLFDGEAETILRESGQQDIWPEFDYKINNGYIVFRKLGNLGQNLIMLRKPSGDIVTVAPFGSHSYIEAINDIGEVIFFNNDKRYLYTEEGVIFQISNNTLGRPYYKNDNWYITMGNTLFLIDTSITLAVNDFEEIHSENIIIYPNPTFDEIHVKLNNNFSNNKIEYRIFNMMGQEVLNGDLSDQNNNSIKIDFTSLNSGVYFLNILHLEKTIIKKIIKK